MHFVLDCWFLCTDLNEMCFSLTVSGNWTLHLWKGFSHIFHWESESRFFRLFSEQPPMEDVMDEPRCCWIAFPRYSAIHLQWIRHAEMAKKLNVSRNGSTSFLTAGQSTCTGRFLSPLHARLSLNTWQVKPDGTGSGLGGRVGVYGRRRRGDARSDPKCLDLCVHCMCGCSNQLPHRSFPFFPLLSLSLCLSLLSKVTAILIVCSQAGIAALFFSVGGPCETLQCKYLFCYLIHFFGSFLLEAASVFFFFPHHSTWTIAHHTSVGESGSGWDVAWVGGV